jgi:hypothetical protein
MGEVVTVQRVTKITIGDQVISIMTEDETKLIEALTKKDDFTPLNPMKVGNFDNAKLDVRA